MNYSDIEIVLQEIPGEISICFTITGCKLKCQGCHSPYLWKEENGKLLTPKIYNETLKKYKGFASAVLFMGGEWFPKTLKSYLKIAKNMGFKTCLYTGLNSVDSKIMSQLTYLKIGNWQNHLGGLDSKKTNQKFIEVQSNNNLNHLFLKN